MTLHTVNKSPFSSNILAQCLTIAAFGHSVVLIEDGVYGALSSNPVANTMSQLDRQQQCRFFVLDADLQARGLSPEQLLPYVKTIGYDKFVQLAVEHTNVQSWF